MIKSRNTLKKIVLVGLLIMTIVMLSAIGVTVNKTNDNIVYGEEGTNSTVEYKCIIAEDEGLTFASTKQFKISPWLEDENGTLSYSIDGKKWSVCTNTEINNGVESEMSAIDNNYYLYFRGTGNKVISNGTYWMIENSDGSTSGVSCFGNIETLLDYEQVKAGNHPEMSDYCFASLFSDCYLLETAPKLPATELTEYCYNSMFLNCTSLKEAPELPAMEVARASYNKTFYGCSLLEKAPNLPATKIGMEAYASMFGSCTKLKNLPNLPATEVGKGAYYSMFNYCGAIDLSTSPDAVYKIPWTLPSNIDKDDLSFAFRNIKLDGNAVGSLDNLEASLELGKEYYQKAVDYNITYYDQGNKDNLKFSGEGIEDTDKTYNNASSKTLPTPTKKEYEFKGWYTKYNGGDFVTEIPQYDLGNKTYYAKWEKERNRYNQ